MAHPKSRHSKARTAARKNSFKLTQRPFYIDPATGEATLMHRVNLTSGNYRGKQVIEGTEEATGGN
jgi:large subunit ribosomal protein L32